MSATPAQNTSIKTALIITSIVVLILLAIYVMGRKAGKQKSELKEAAEKWGKDDWGSPIANTNASQIPAGWQPDGLAKELFDAMDGVFTTSETKSLAFGKILALTDAQVIEVYKRFTERFAEKPDTLTTWIKDELYGGGRAKDQALARLAQLNLP